MTLLSDRCLITVHTKYGRSECFLPSGHRGAHSGQIEEERITDLEAQLDAEKRRADELAAHLGDACDALVRAQQMRYIETVSGITSAEARMHAEKDLGDLTSKSSASLAHIKAQAMREAAAICEDAMAHLPGVELLQHDDACVQCAEAIEARADELESKAKEIEDGR